MNLKNEISLQYAGIYLEMQLYTCIARISGLDFHVNNVSRCFIAIYKSLHRNI